MMTLIECLLKHSRFTPPHDAATLMPRHDSTMEVEGGGDARRGGMQPRQRRQRDAQPHKRLRNGTLPHERRSRACERVSVSGAALPEYGEGNANGKARQ